MPGLGNDRNTWSWSCLIYICEKLQAGRSWLELVQYHPGWCWYRVVRKLLCKAPWVQIGWNYHGMCTVYFSHIIHIWISDTRNIWISDTRNIYKYSSKTGMCAVSLYAISSWVRFGQFPLNWILPPSIDVPCMYIFKYIHYVWEGRENVREIVYFVCLLGGGAPKYM